MHEQSLVRSLLSQVEQLRIDHGALGVARVEVEIGPLSGVEPLLVREAFDLLTAGTAQAGMELAIREVPLQCRCRDCGGQWGTSSFRSVCPECGATAVQITSGDEFRITNITVLTPEQSGENA